MIPSTTSRLKMRLDFSYGHPSDFSRGQSLLLHFLQVSVAGAMSSVNQLSFLEVFRKDFSNKWLTSLFGPGQIAWCCKSLAVMFRTVSPTIGTILKRM